MGNQGIGGLVVPATGRIAAFVLVLVLGLGPGLGLQAAILPAGPSTTLPADTPPRPETDGPADAAACGSSAELDCDKAGVAPRALTVRTLFLSPALLLFLAMALLHGALIHLLRRRRIVQGRPKSVVDARREAEQEDDKAERMDTLLNEALKRGGIHVLFVGTYVILGLYLLAPVYGNHESLELLQFVAAALAPLLTVASIYFVVRQLRRNEEAVWATTVEQVHARMHDIHRIFLAEPELRGYFYDGLPLLEPAAAITGAEYRATKVRVMAEMICDYFEQIIWHSRHLPTQQAKTGWRLFMTRMFQDSPVLRQHLRAHGSMYPKELLEIANSAAAGLLAIVVDDAESPWLSKGHAVLAAEFGPRGEMETLDQLQKRLFSSHGGSPDGYHMTYEMMLLVEDDNSIVGVGDYCVIVPEGVAAAHHRDRPVVGFLSHLWIAPGHRRRSLTRRILERLETLLAVDGQNDTGARVLVAEVDPPRPGDREREQRLDYFGRVGYVPVHAVSYLQPDFNADGGGGASVPVPLLLLLRRLGSAAESELNGAQLRHIVTSIYAMYARSVDERHIAAVRASLADYPAPTAVIRLDATKPQARASNVPGSGG